MAFSRGWRPVSTRNPVFTEHPARGISSKTIPALPNHAPVESGFSKWRGTQEADGRRIKRSVYLDQATVRFLDEGVVTRLWRIELLAPYLDEKKQELGPEAFGGEQEGSCLVNGMRLTNLGTFRVSVER